MMPRHTGKRTPALIARRLLLFAFALQLSALLAVGLPTLHLITAGMRPLLAAAPPGFIQAWLRDCVLDLGVVLLMSMLVAWQLIQFAVGAALSGPMTLLSRLMARAAQGDFTHVVAYRSRDELGRYIAKANALIARLGGGTAGLLHWEGEAVPFVRLAFFILIFADSLCYSFLPVLARDLHAGSGARLAASLPVSLFWMVVAAAQLAAPRLPHEYRKGALLVGTLVLAIGLEGCASADTLTVLILWRALCGIGVGLGMALAQDYMLSGLSGQGRTYAAALYLATYFAGAVCGTSIGSVIAGQAGYRVTLLLAAGLSLIALLPASWAGAPAAPAALPVSAAEAPGPLRRLARNGRFLSVVLLAAIPSRFLMSAFLYYLIPLHLAEIGTSRSEIARVIMIYSLVMALAGPPLGQLADRVGRPFPLVVAGMLMSAAAPLLGALMPTPLGIGIALGLLGTAHAFGLSSQVALLLNVTAEECGQLGNAAVVGLYRVSERIGTVAGPLLVALIVTRWDYPGGMIGIGALVLAAALLLLMTFSLAGLSARLRRGLPAAGLALIAASSWQPPAHAAEPLKIAVAVALTHNQTNQGEDILRAAEMAAEDANADPVLSADDVPPVDLRPVDDGGTPEGARAVANRLAASDTLAVIGPLYSTQLAASAPVYAAAGMVALSPTAHVDHIADSATTFRGVYGTNAMGEAFADYLHYALGIDKAVVLMKNDDYGHLIGDGFRHGADRLSIAADYYDFDDASQSAALAARIAAAPGGRAVIVAALQDDAVPLLRALRRAGWNGPVIATDALARDSLSGRFAGEPEERDHAGYFIEGMYVASPTILDNASADTLAFAHRFQVRFGHLPNWDAIATYESGRVLMTATRLSARSGTTDLSVRRHAVQAQLTRLDGPDPIRDGPLGRPWFDAEHGRHQPVRFGRFHDGLIESAPLQLAASLHADPDQIASGELVPVADGYARLQRVIYAGLHLNDLSELDTAQFSFKADFYVWLRYGEDHRPGAADPLDIDFPDLIGKAADAIHPVERSTLPDGTVYRLLHVRGAFRSDFDLHRYPFDRQTLKIRFFNGRAASDGIIYALDRRSATVAAQLASRRSSLDGADSPFRNLTEWTPVAASAGRNLLVTESALGDPRLAGAERRRELSGFYAVIELHRRLIAVLAKVLLPLALMTLILLASHFFTGDLERHRIDVAITGVLSGAVLLTAINAQLGNYGYTMEVEYIFYVFFFLCFLSITATAIAEGFRLAGHPTAARRTMLTVRYVSMLAVLATILAQVNSPA